MELGKEFAFGGSAGLCFITAPHLNPNGCFGREFGIFQKLARARILEVIQKFDDWACLPGEIAFVKEIRTILSEKDNRL